MPRLTLKKAVSTNRDYFWRAYCGAIFATGLGKVGNNSLCKPADQRVILPKLVYRNKNMTLTIVSLNLNNPITVRIIIILNQWNLVGFFTVFFEKPSTINALPICTQCPTNLCGSRPPGTHTAAWNLAGCVRFGSNPKLRVFTDSKGLGESHENSEIVYKKYEDESY